MKVKLAGFNVDAEVLKEMSERAGERDDITPEVLSASYARISRDGRPIDEIRREARLEVERARKSNSSIIFKMGHHSVAEHAVFNLDILGISRLAMEELEKFRLSSYTEKSQRYITLNNDFVVPEEIKESRLKNLFVKTIHAQNETYFRFFEKLKGHLFNKHSDLASDEKNHNLIEGWAKEDARYVTALATGSQVGQTVNARTLELILRRFASQELSEVRSLGEAIYREISGVAPSIVLFHKANNRDLKTYPELKAMATAMIEAVGTSADSNDTELVEFTPGGDDIIAAALLHTSTDLDYPACKICVERFSRNKIMEIFRTAWRNMEFYDSMPREFEYADLTFNISLSAACFGQLKRHRMTTITAQGYEPALGVTVPESFKEVGIEKEFREMIKRTEEVYEQIKRENPVASPYILTNAHKKRVLIKVNARELYHISRLREDAHSQWDIRNIASQMTQKAREVMPMTFAFAGGKDRFGEIREKIFGE
jgi:flavin-dependent thymidylate synthase